MNTLDAIDHFLNTHWEFVMLANLLVYWLFYRQGFKAGRADMEEQQRQFGSNTYGEVPDTRIDLDRTIL